MIYNGLAHIFRDMCYPNQKYIMELFITQIYSTGKLISSKQVLMIIFTGFGDAELNTPVTNDGVFADGL